MYNSPVYSMAAGMRNLKQKLRIYLRRSPFACLFLILHLRRLIRNPRLKFPVFRRYCPLCGQTTRFIKLGDSEWGINCIRCWATPPVMCFTGVMTQVIDKPLGQSRVYEMSSSGPLYRYLRKHSKHFSCSEYYDGLPPGHFRNGVPCQDVENLTFKDNWFDLVTCTEMFEHVPDDLTGFSEICRILKPGGWFVMMVPFYEHPTVERVVIKNGHITHLLPPEFHMDPIRPGGCLCFRNYGPDIVDRLEQSGFAKAQIIKGEDYSGAGHIRYIIAARKGG